MADAAPLEDKIREFVKLYINTYMRTQSRPTATQESACMIKAQELEKLLDA